jgi:hypothetical protein
MLCSYDFEWQGGTMSFNVGRLAGIQKQDAQQKKNKLLVLWHLERLMQKS